MRDRATHNIHSVDRAHDKLIAAAHRAQADALEIEAGAKRRLADEYDAAQERAAAVAATQGELRETHLKYHLSTADILNPGQMQRYVELRGYTATVNIKSAITTDPMKPSQAGFRYP